MADKFAAELRSEIGDFLQRRHDLIIRKFSFCSGLIGVGSLSISYSGDKQLLFSDLLYVVPLIAIAFDFQIAVEDHRVKRAGVFLRQLTSDASDAEKEYEAFVKANPNKIAPFAFPMLAFIMLSGCTFLLWRAGAKHTFLIAWFSVTLILESCLVVYTSSIRTLMSKNISSPNP